MLQLDDGGVLKWQEVYDRVGEYARGWICLHEVHVHYRQLLTTRSLRVNFGVMTCRLRVLFDCVKKWEANSNSA